MFLFVLLILSIILLIFSKDKYAILIHLAIITDGFRFYFLPKHYLFGMSYQPMDLSYLFIFFCYIHYAFKLKASKAKYNKSPMIGKHLCYFLFFVFIVGLIDYFYNSTSILDMFRTTRAWLTILIIPILGFLSLKDLKWLIKVIVLITFIQICIIPIQHLLPFKIPGSVRSDGSGGVRYGMMPYFWFLYIWYIIYSPKIKGSIKIIGVLLLFMAFFVALARKNFVAVFIPLIFFYLFEMKVRNILFVIIFIFLSSFWYLNYAPPRIKTLHTDVEKIFTTDINNYGIVHDPDQGNATFRAFLLLERYNYLKKKPHTFLFGYGLIHEQNMKERPFRIGQGERVAQLDIGDISWAAILVRYGIIGVFFVAYYVVFFLISFYKNRKDPYAKIGFLYVASVIVLSFGDAYLLYPFVLLVPYILYLISKQNNLGD